MGGGGKRYRNRAQKQGVLFSRLPMVRPSDPVASSAQMNAVRARVDAAVGLIPKGIFLPSVLRERRFSNGLAREALILAVQTNSSFEQACERVIFQALVPYRRKSG
ncbi:MAG: hypothetical protein HY917_01245 [Candidatus Diapherotrites archaeon]|nr:hypothetical protein [Candidatus Diapherotrites archaeon]